MMEPTYNIWKFNKTTNQAQLIEKNLEIYNAFDYTTFEMKRLKPNEQLMTESNITGKVDMVFERESSITPKKPFDIQSKAKTIKMGNTIKPVTKSSKQYSKKMNKFNSPTKSRGKWVGNMFRLSNSTLSQLGKTGTPKQKKLAKSIIARRRKK